MMKSILLGSILTLLVNNLTACANDVTAKQLPAIVGADSSRVTMFIKNDGSAVILSGQVDRSIEKNIIEEYVRDEYGYKVISNRITSTH